MTFFEVFQFKKKREEAFQYFFYKQDLVVCRTASLLVIAIMLILIVVDFYRVNNFSWVVIARLIVCSVLVVLIFFTYQKNFTVKQLQFGLVIINVIFLGSLFFMETSATMPPFYLSNSIVVYIFLVSTVSGLRFRYSSVLIILLVALFLAFSSPMNSTFHNTQTPNIIISLAVGLSIGYIWERNKRINFLQQNQLNSLINIFSHDMVSPLNSLLSLLSLNDRNLLDKSELDTHIVSIKKATSNNIMLLQNLVKWSKSQMNGFTPKAEVVEINKLLNEVIELLEHTATEKDITINNLATKGYTCIGDLEMIKLILRNTLSNAIKFSHPNSAIEVSLFRENGFITISLNDEGIGMSQEEIDRLFVTTVQSTPGTANERGTGIGLYITREFINLNKGQIKVESEKGKGSIVKISFPEGTN